MVAQKGALMLLKIKLADAENFTTLGGLKTTRFVLNNQLIDITTKESGSWRELLATAGIAALSIAATGIFTDSDSERLMREYCFNRQIMPYLLQFGNGDKIEGQFLVSSYERAGNYNEEENYAITLESSGPIAYNMATDI